MKKKNIDQVILKSLEEEKRPIWKSWLKAFFISSIVACGLSALVYWRFSGMPEMAQKACIGWAICLFLGFLIYFRPHPRVEVKSFWSTYVISKLILMMTVLNFAQILLCPHFAFGHQNVSMDDVILFGKLPDLFMSWGGMNFCMSLCGLLFTGMGGILSFTFICRTLSFQKLSGTMIAVGIAYLTQIPILLLQFSDEHLRQHLPYWFGGSLLGLIAAGIVVTVGMEIWRLMSVRLSR